MYLQCDKRELRRRVVFNDLFAFSLINSYRFKVDNDARLIKLFRDVKHAKEIVHSNIEFDACKRLLMSFLNVRDVINEDVRDVNTNKRNDSNNATFKTILTHVDEDVDSNVEDACEATFNAFDRDICEIAFNNVINFVKIVSIATFNSEEDLLEIVSINAMTNIDILEIDDRVNEVNELSMLIMTKRLHLEDVFEACFNAFVLLRQFCNCCKYCL